MPATRPSETSNLDADNPAQNAPSKPPKKAKVERVHTDAILAIKPEFINLIAAQKKNHEFRAYKMRDTVIRIWLYTTAPTSAITHVMTTGPPKTPGEICDPTGIGNEDFDKGLKKSKFGYPVLELYILETPLKLDAMRDYGVPVPQGLVYAPKRLVDDIPIPEMEKLF